MAIYVYQTIKARRILRGAPQLSRGKLFFRFYMAVLFLFLSYFGISIALELHGKGVEAFSMLIPVLLACVALCGFALYRELGDLEDDFEGLD
ncbi:hypothetical protein WJ542_27135 [Paraburkholderia sp. B3]|uniref:hypothetical protein n=1 Tax=Paraburkholderia sp. B3 TaxID=3134791 RepID=UPI003981AAAE